ncbi:conserved Plasmodium protein, unknown function [Plasmodium berghei]|uniref:CKK domain-containing protein, putative n=2 Tax=Plasmodium berghei TaxID=5821 RepID=A0A509AS86_PLABA|nr:CKK domain-containing protein, putative [Plasmodium berghei ANKA]CXI97738.1 conserved Plasmodium protein, unknown function [Plasmodium berghei]SCL97583.1 conserved Plasmodium protein, unknown function [Plasmodium berghei]SCM16639.1 conserved Plasmodium protein, unknown function [Plasmodium berghei]SCN27867.1 conserved Plasmodium protein, unknown function [Plasmodium berghei]VUC57751.1 CKK domain-containing protein, putative [Plasmodium berghei ANKA]|eukprot:XP_034423521.1 CKK domain-containing protein, putative [Plasmodium berghei ANKA]
MNKSEENEQTKKSSAYKTNKKKLCKNIMNEEYPFYVNYDILVKNYKNEKNYIDLNLEINYNLEEIEENNENIKKCIFIPNSKNKDNLWDRKSRSKNEKINNQHETNYNIDSKNNFISTKYKKKSSNPNCENRESGRTNHTNRSVSSGEEGKANSDKNKSEDNIKNKNNHESYSSDSNDTYCSELSENYSEIEKKSMNFSQRITYDDIILNKINLYDTTLDLNSYMNNKNKNKDKNDADHISYGVNKLKRVISNSSSLLFADNNTENFDYTHNKISSNNDNRSDRNNTELYSSNIFSKHHKYAFLDKLYCSKEEERNKLNNPVIELARERSSPIHLQFNKNDKILNRRKSEDDILNKYEKIIKIMKYLRRIKTRHPEIETIVSILSNNIKNVTFNCEKMFSSRRELNDFLKKIYIYQIFILKKVVFKNNYSPKNNYSKKCNSKNPSMQSVSFVNINKSHLRDYSEIPDDTKRDSNYLLYYLSKNRSFNIPNNLLYENSNVNKDHINRNRQNGVDTLGNIHKYIDLKSTKNIENRTYYAFKNEKDRKNDKNKKYNNKSSDNSDEEKNQNYERYDNKIKEKKKKNHRNNEHNINSNNALDKIEMCQEKRGIFVKPRKNHILNIKNELTNTREIYNNDDNNSNTFVNVPLNECKPNTNYLKRIDNAEDRHVMDNAYTKGALECSNLNITQKRGQFEKKYIVLKKELNMNALNLENKCAPIRKNISENERFPNNSIDKDKLDKKTYVLYYDVNKEINTISNRNSVTNALKTTLLNKPQNFAALQNFLFKIEVELVEYKHFILLITKNVKKLSLEALYGLNDFSVFEKVYGKKIAPRFLVSQKVKMFYKYDIFYQRFKELENVRAFSGITDAVELI